MTNIPPKTRTIITIILLLVTLVWFPSGLIGVIVMWFWTSWAKWVKTVITVVIVVPFILLLMSSTLVLSTFFIKPFQVSGNNMSPNYKNGEYLITTIFNPNKDTINRNDVIVFKSPQNTQMAYIQRAVALPNETVMIKDGHIYVNNQKLDESKYLPIGVKTYEGTFLKNEQLITVPSGEYFVLGDNRENSSDSREWGFVPQNNIISKVSFCYWNCSK